MKKYSPSYNAFYETTINNDIPDDAIDISDEKWVSLLEGQAQGKVIGCGPDNRPCLKEPPQPSAEELFLLAKAKKIQLRALADAAILPLQDAIDLQIASQDERSLLKDWKKYRVELMRIEILKGVDIIWPEIP